MTRRRGHPWLFVLAAGTSATAWLSGDVLAAVVTCAVAVWLAVR